MYINENTLEYPLTENQIKIKNPNVSFPIPFEPPPGYSFVSIIEKPAFNQYIEKVVEVDPVKVNGIWTQQWAIVALSVDEISEKLSSVRILKCNNIKTVRDYKTQNGGYRVGTKWYHSDTFSRTQQLGLRLEGENLPTGIMWKTMDGSFVEMTPALAQQIFSAAVAQDTALFSYAEYLQALVNVAADPGSIDITVGWPETFNNV